MDGLWDKDPQELVRQLEACLKLNEAYQEQYRATKAKLGQAPKGKQFDFSDIEVHVHHTCRVCVSKSCMTVHWMLHVSCITTCMCLCVCV